MKTIKPKKVARKIPSIVPKPSGGNGGGGGGRVPLPGMGFRNKEELLRSKLNEAETKLTNLGKKLTEAKTKGNTFEITKIKGQMKQTRKFIKEAPKIYRNQRRGI
jgi:5-bromo-4-chloroindolyl phosphate hydrolysis protein